MPVAATDILLLDVPAPATEQPVGAALPMPVAAAPTAIAMRPALPQPSIEKLTLAIQVETEARPAEPAEPAATAPDAATAASLLIAVATPAPAKPVAAKPAEGEAETGGEAGEASEADADTVKDAPVAATPTAPVSLPAAADMHAAAVPAPAAVAMTPRLAVAARPAAERPADSKSVAADIAPSQPVAARMPADKAAKGEPAAATPHREEGAAPSVQATAAAKPRELPAVAIAAAEPRAAKPAFDAGAAVTVLFNQPELQGATPLAAAAKAAPVAERVIDMTSDDQWIAQLAADIAATKSDRGDISFRLVPRHLGRLDVSMLSGDDGVSLKLDTQHEATATIVSAAQPRLVEDLRQQGVRVAGAEVTCTPGETGRQSQQGQGRAAQADASHLIETATDRADRRGDSLTDERAADRRGRFA
jgi:flagellar hook-length control protein FliK